MDSQPPLLDKLKSLEEARISSLPQVAYYVADFITPEEEETLLRKVGTASSFYNTAFSEIFCSSIV